MPGPEASSSIRDFEFPQDLLAVLAILGLTNLSLLAPVIRETPLRIVTGFVVLLFLPGYSLIAIIFPETGSRSAPDTDREQTPGQRGIDGIERVTLSIAISLVIVMGVPLGLNTAGIPITLQSTLLALNVILIGSTLVAWVRRQRLPPDDRFRVNLRGVVKGIRIQIAELDRLNRFLAILFIVLLVGVAAGTAYTATVPSDNERFTEFYLLSEGPNGELQASNYPTNLSVGETASLVVGIDNHEFEQVNYTVVVELQNVTRRSANPEVISEQKLHRFTPVISHKDRWRQSHTINSNRTGTNLRLQYLLYRGTPPQTPTQENAYRYVNLWINITGKSHAPEK